MRGVDKIQSEREVSPEQLASKIRADSKVKPHVRIINGALDEAEDGSIIVNGRIDASTLRFLKVDNSYQRPLNLGRKDIWDALKAGKVVPPIDIGVRGLDFTTDCDDIIITEPAYIIDGWQRVGNAMALMEAVPDHAIRMFATLHFGTDDIWERHRFTELNKNVRKVSSNLHLRNMRDGNEAVLTIYGLSTNTPTFPLFRRVCWSQNMHRNDLISAKTLAIVSVYLHAHKTGLSGGSTERTAESMLTAAKGVGLQRFRQNLVTFYEMIEEVWGVRDLDQKFGAVQVKSQFMITLARIFSDHMDFWNDNDHIFFVSADMRKKLGTLKLNDPNIKVLASSTGTAGAILRRMIIDHMDKGRRNKMQFRHQVKSTPFVKKTDWATPSTYVKPKKV